MIIDLFTVIFTLFQGLIFVKFADGILEKKKIGNIYKIIGTVIFVIFNCFISIIFLIYVSQYVYWLSSVAFILAYISYLYIYYHSDIIENIITSFTYYITCWFVTYLVYYFFDVLNNYVSLNTFIFDYVSTFIALAIVYLLISKIIPRFMDYKDAMITVPQFGLLLFFCLTGFISLMSYDKIFAIVIGAICNVAIIMLSSYINNLDQEREQNQLLLERNKLLEEQDILIKQKEAEKYQSYQKSLESDERIRRINHDLNHHFNYILSCENDIEKIRKYIYELKGQVNEGSKYFDTGSSIIDLILEEQYRKAEKLGVKFSVIGEVEDGLKIEPAAASIILGNLLNNAFEAVSKLKEGYKKVSVNFYQEPKKEFYLKVVNTADLKELKMVEGKLETSKEDKENHGIGLGSVREAVKASGGTIKVETEDNNFEVEIHIPIR